MRALKAFLLLYAFTAPLASCQSQRVVEEFSQAKKRLLEVSMKSDSAGIVQARQRFERLLQNENVARHDSLAAWSHYFIGFANWQMAFVTFGNTEGAKKTASEAIMHLQAATKLKANLVDAYVVLRRCYFWQYLLDPRIGMAGWRESAAVLQKAKEFAPENPRVIFEEAIDWFKFDLERLPNPNAFGLNLIVDTDQNQQNGANWWGNILSAVRMTALRFPPTTARKNFNCETLNFFIYSEGVLKSGLHLFFTRDL